MKKDIITFPAERIANRILLIRGKKVIIDRDLAELYKVNTKVLNQAVKRNKERFPEDFMFQLNKNEKAEVVTICDHLKNLKFSPQLPYVFTELGVAMLSSVLKSKKAIQVNIEIMRTFSKLRELLVTNEALRKKIEIMERKYDSKLKVVFDLIQHLLPDSGSQKQKIGFKVK